MTTDADEKITPETKQAIDEFLARPETPGAEPLLISDEDRKAELAIWKELLIDSKKRRKPDALAEIIAREVNDAALRQELESARAEIANLRYAVRKQIEYRDAVGEQLAAKDAALREIGESGSVDPEALRLIRIARAALKESQERA